MSVAYTGISVAGSRAVPDRGSARATGLLAGACLPGERSPSPSKRVRRPFQQVRRLGYADQAAIVLHYVVARLQYGASRHPGPGAIADRGGPATLRDALLSGEGFRTRSARSLPMVAAAASGRSTASGLSASSTAVQSRARSWNIGRQRRQHLADQPGIPAQAAR
jgi:hypothetical protein